MGFFCHPTGLQWWVFCSPNLRVVEPWSLPELDPVRFVFFFVVFVCCWCKLLDPGSGLWEWRMLTVSGGVVLYF